VDPVKTKKNRVDSVNNRKKKVAQGEPQITSLRNILLNNPD
jgi:hypothetical protein